MHDPDFDWIVVGGGGAGIATAEILSRLGKSVLLIEKNSKLAAETSRIFHEWLHTGSLYTLTPDRLKTTRYLLGAIDDLLEYYSSFERMNIVATTSGLNMLSNGWFNDKYIYYRYKMHPLNPFWSLVVARSQWLINEIKQHDWLRRRAGTIHDDIRFNFSKIIKNYPLQCSEFLQVCSPDVTMNSRVLLTDLLVSYERSGGKIMVNCDVEKIIDHNDEIVKVYSNHGQFFSKKVVICAADGITRFTDINVKISYAPMFIVDGVDDGTESFVELDYILKSCINLLVKGNGYGLAGGISVDREDEIQDYYNYCVELHKKRNPNIRVLDMYIGLKKEVVSKGQDRNYLYHINKISKNVWGIILGKFTLMFSLAPEFVRRVYNKNPPQFSKENPDPIFSQHPLLSNTQWLDSVLIKGDTHGNN